MKPMNAKMLKPLRKAFEEQYGITEKPEYAFFLTEKDDVWVVSEAVKQFPLEAVHVHSFGIYIGEWKHGFRPSIEGSQLLGSLATKNVLEISSNLRRMWMYGLDIPVEGEWDTFVILKCEEDYLGSGFYKEGKIMNHVPKGRRIHE